MSQKPKVHALTLEFNQLCGYPSRFTTIVDGTRKDPLARLITCKTCRRRWKNITV